LIDLAGKSPRPPAGEIKPARFAGRFTSLWGVIDIAVLGGRLFRIHPAQPDPTENVAELQIVDETTLRVAGGDGYGSFGEAFTFTFAGDGTVVGVRGDSQVSLVPLPAFQLSPVVPAADRRVRSPETPAGPG
jgi:hypothetical protein